MMLDSLVQELDSYTDENFLVSNLAVQVQTFYRLYQQEHISKDVFLRQIDTVIGSQVERTNDVVSDKIKFDSFLYRFKEWLER